MSFRSCAALVRMARWSLGSKASATRICISPPLPSAKSRRGSRSPASATGRGRWKSKSWLEQVAGTLNILAMDARTFRLWGRLMHRKPDHLIEDAMIAATASIHGLTVVTRNLRDFEGFDVQIFNPFGAERE